MRSPLIVVETERLVLRWLSPGDSRFILELVNEPAWRRYIGDKGIRSIEEAEAYIRNGPLEMYARLGFGLYLVETKANAERIGICGFIKRETLDDVDLGFAFLARFRGMQYAFESASAALSYGKDTLGMSRVVAITSPDNERSVKLLERLGFRFERTVQLNAAGDQLRLYAATLYSGGQPDAPHAGCRLTDA